MELDELRDIWNETAQKHSERYWINASVVKGMIEQRSHTTVANIKRTLLFKIRMAGFTGLVSLVMAGFHLFNPLQTPLFLEQMLTLNEAGIINLVLGALLIGIAYSNYQNYLRIVRFDKSAEPLQLTLVAIREIIQRIMKLVIYSDLIFSPLIVGFISYLSLFQRDGFLLDHRIAYLLLAVTVTGILSYVINRWFLKRKFSRDLNRINECLNELDTLDQETI